MNWATVPTMISVRAVETRNHIASRVAMSASPSHSAASAQTAVMINSIDEMLWVENRVDEPGRAEFCGCRLVDLRRQRGGLARSNGL
jgi:hypothetical protein